MTTMYDAVTVSNIPRGAAAVAGYVGGSWPTFSNLVAAFPNAHHLSVAVNAGEDAECLDIESGDASPGQAPAWYQRQRSRGVWRPVFYANTSTMPSVVAALSGAGVKREDYRLWTAHYTGVAHIEPGSDATQWTDVGLGRSLDVSLCSAAFLASRPVPPVVKNSPHYDWFENTSFRIFGLLYNERATVQEYDRLRATQTWKLHPNRVRLAVLRARLTILAGRVLRVAKDQSIGGKPSWSLFHRGWRYQQLIHRSQGQRFI